MLYVYSECRNPFQQVYRIRSFISMSGNVKEDVFRNKKACTDYQCTERRASEKKISLILHRIIPFQNAVLNRNNSLPQNDVTISDTA